MKQFFFSMVWTVIASSALFFVSCSEDESPGGDVEKEVPEVQLDKVSEGSESLSFSILVKNAEKAAYVLIKDGHLEPSADEILKSGKDVSLNEEKIYVESDLETSTSYNLIVVAVNGEKNKVGRLSMSTAEHIDASYKAQDCMAIYYGNRYVRTDKSLYNYYFILSDVGFDDKSFPNPNGQFFFRIDLFNVKAEDPENAIIPEGVYKFDGTAEEPGLQLIGSKSGFFRTDGQTFHTDKHDFKDVTLTVTHTETGWRYEVLAVLDNGKVYYVEYEGQVSFENQSNDDIVGQNLPSLEDNLNCTFTYGEGFVSYQEGSLSQVDMTFTDMKIDGSSLLPPGNVLYLTFITEVKNGRLPEKTFCVEGESETDFFVPGQEVEEVPGFYAPAFTCVQIVKSDTEKKTGYCIDGTVTVARTEKGYKFDFDLKTLDGHSVTASYDGPFAIYGPGTSMLTEDTEVELPNIGAKAWFYGDAYKNGNGYWEITISPGWSEGGSGYGLLFNFFTEGTEYTTWLDSHTFNISDKGDPFTALPGALKGEGEEVQLLGTNYVRYESYQIVDTAPLISGTIVLTKGESGYYTIELDCKDDSGHSVRGIWNNQFYPADKTPSVSSVSVPVSCHATRLYPMWTDIVID